MCPYAHGKSQQILRPHSPMITVCISMMTAVICGPVADKHSCTYSLDESSAVVESFVEASAIQYPILPEDLSAILPASTKLRKRNYIMWKHMRRRFTQLIKIKSKVYRRKGWHRERGQLWCKPSDNMTPTIIPLILVFIVIL